MDKSLRTKAAQRASLLTLPAEQARLLKAKYQRHGQLGAPRKGVAPIVQLLNFLIAQGITKVRSEQLADDITRLGRAHYWDRDKDALDQHGLRRSIADVLGGGKGGLHLACERQRGGNTYHLPTKPIDQEFLASVGIDPEQVLAQLVDRRIVDAIWQRHALQIRYDGDPVTATGVAPIRIVHPHAYYQCKGTGGQIVLCRQVYGYSSQELPGWRKFNPDKIRALKQLPVHFKPADDFKPLEGEASNVYATVR